jgi:cysteine-rich repeat protein
MLSVQMGKTCSALLVVGFLLTSACSRSHLHGEPHGTDAGDVVEEDAHLDGPSQAELTWPDPTPSGPDVPPPLDPPPHCGDGILDDGEECDDRNRLNDDGCDWLCRLGDGEPDPPLDPTPVDFAPSGSPVIVDGDPDEMGWRGCGWNLPLVWTGEEYAAAFCVHEGRDHRECPCSIRFLRFDSSGIPVDAGWSYALPDVSYGLDMVWTGTGFGLFFDVTGYGIFLVTLDARGKPLGDPVLVEPDPEAAGPVVDMLDGQYVMSWTSMPTEMERQVRVKHVDLDGVSPGFPVAVVSGRYYVLDIAAAGLDSMVTLLAPGSSDWPPAHQALWIDSDLEAISFSGYLSDGSGGDVIHVGGAFVTAWTHFTLDGDFEPYDTCVARFSFTGILEAAPVCTPTGLYDGMHGHPGYVHLAAGLGGLGLAWQWDSDIPDAKPMFVRADLRGVVISDHLYLGGASADTGYHMNMAIAWGPGEYALAFHAEPRLWMQRIMPVD